MTVLRGARLIDPASGVDTKADITISDGKITEVVKAGGASATGAIDCEGLVVAPGFVDLHVHFREPGAEDAETIASGSAAAALGGFVAVCPMPNTDPPQDGASVVEHVWRRAREVGLVDAYPIGAITAGRAGERLAPMREMFKSAAKVRLFSDDGDPVPNASLIRRAFEYARTFDGVIIEHAEDPSLRDGLMHEGEISAILGLRGIPAEAEEICVLRDIAMARLVGGRLHIAHLSTARAAEAVRAAKAEGIRITCEVTPHHISLTDEAVSTYDPAFKVAPPLRSAEHVDALKKAIVDGTIDAIATDHAPHAPHTKDREFEYAPCGMVGLETALGVAIAELVDTGLVPLSRVVELMSSGPANILGVEGFGGPLAAGADANLVIFDPEAAWSVEPGGLASRSRNTPFAGKKLKGRVIHTMLRGRFTVKDSEVAA